MLFIFEFLLALAGVLALCIGIFFVIPIIYAANAFAYRQVFPWVRDNFNMAPPPPTAYGDFGSGMAAKLKSQLHKDHLVRILIVWLDLVKAVSQYIADRLSHSGYP